jgi:hypothetical protein
MVFADRIVAVNPNLYYTFDGKAWTSHTPGFIDLWRGGKKLYGLREDGHVHVTEDALRWSRVTNREGVPAPEFDRAVAKGKPIHRGAVVLDRGRLFVGTSAEGKIFAAPYEERGSCTAKPVRLVSGAQATLSWDATAGVRIRYRTAETAEELSKASWKEAAESPVTITLPKKHAWAQARAELESDGRRTPILRSLRIE